MGYGGTYGSPQKLKRVKWCFSLRVKDYHTMSVSEDRAEYVEDCIQSGHILPFTNNEADYFSHYQDLEMTDSRVRQVFLYNDEYGRQRYYTVDTYLPEVTQLGSAGPCESLGFHSDELGTPLCPDQDPFNWGDVNNTGEHLMETHYATCFDLRLVCHYWWDLDDDTDTDDYDSSDPSNWGTGENIYNSRQE
jgi:hypothetical protein